MIFAMSLPDLTMVCETIDKLAMELTDLRLLKARTTRTVTRARPFEDNKGKTDGDMIRNMMAKSNTFQAVYI